MEIKILYEWTCYPRNESESQDWVIEQHRLHGWEAFAIQPVVYDKWQRRVVVRETILFRREKRDESK